jgi:ribosomal protein S14
MSNKFLQVSDFYKRLYINKKSNNLKMHSSLSRDVTLPKSLIFQNTNKKNTISIKNRCVLTGRSRAVDKKLRISRMPLKYLSIQGFLPGINKFSW